VTLLVVGVSHRTAPVALLDRVALVDGSAERLQLDLLASPHVAESLVLSTCNRVEVYAEVSKFHGGVLDVTETLAKVTGLDREELTPHLYVRYEDRAVQHMFEVTSGLDSMVVGEQQILGQVRSAPRRSRPRSGAASGVSPRPRCASASASTPTPASTAPAHPWCPSRSGSPPTRSAARSRGVARCSSERAP
jgi:glutamyl-tRNA reductase